MVNERAAKFTQWMPPRTARRAASAGRRASRSALALHGIQVDEQRLADGADLSAPRTAPSTGL